MHRLRKWRDCLHYKFTAPHVREHEDDLVNAETHRKLETSSEPSITKTRSIYSTARLGSNTTRMLRLLPRQESEHLIKAELFDYNLSGPSGRKHLYEALSYVWGNSMRTEAILLNGCEFLVTSSLHAALWHLCDRQLERILWVDAICINQDNDEEKEKQIPLMRHIYGQARRVLVWLGPPEHNSDGALRSIQHIARATVFREPSDVDSIGMHSDKCLILLQKEWFHRIWVLQEVGIAQSVTIIYGSDELDGHTFCEGLDHLELSYNLKRAIYPVIQLIRGANYRPHYEHGSNGASYIGELIDMYCSHRATLQHDKVYALLGLSVEGPYISALEPNYSRPWHEVFKQVTAYIFGQSCVVETWPKSDTAVIKGSGLILGRVTSVHENVYGSGQVHIKVHATPNAVLLGYHTERGWDWLLQPPAIPVQDGDIVCHLQGAAKLSIIRLSRDHFTAIKSTAPHPQTAIVENLDVGTSHRSHLIEDHLYDITLVFTIPSGNYNTPSGVERLPELVDVAPEHQEGPSEERKRLRSIEVLLETTALEVLQYGTMSEANKSLIKQSGGNVRISEKVVVAAAGHVNEPYGTMEFLFKQRGDSLPVHEEAIIAAAGNFRGGYSVLQLLFKERGESLNITENVAKAAAGNQEQAYKILSLLFEKRGSRLHISEEVVKAAAGNYWSGDKIMSFLFEKRGRDLPVTEDAIKSAAANTRSGYETMKLLFQQREDLPLSQEVVKEAAGNPHHGYDIMRLLFQQQEHLRISDGVIKAAAENETTGYEIMLLLFEKQGQDLVISDEVVEAALRNPLYGTEIVELIKNRASLMALEETGH